MKNKKTAVIGGGPAGMMAAISGAKAGHRVTLFEQNEKLGKKLFLTGKGRCNITNTAETADFFLNIPRNNKFLYSALYGFTNSDLLEYLHAHGLKTKEERGGRVFPESDHSSDVIKALEAGLKEQCVAVKLKSKVEALVKSGENFALTVGGKTEDFDAVIVATGGLSYPSTGSDGKFFDVVKTLGHTTSDFEPSLVSLKTLDTSERPAGLTLKNAGVEFYNHGKKVYSDFGELLFTHWGISGPVVLSASAYYKNGAFKDAYVLIDLKPALDENKLENRILREISEAPNKDFANLLRTLLPSSLVPHFLDRITFAADTKAHSITVENRKEIVSLLKHYRLDITGKRGIAEAIITRGGISVKEINPSTMESKKIPGLYFAGEMIDVDALTGGFNLQIAFSTGYLAGQLL